MNNRLKHSALIVIVFVALMWVIEFLDRSLELNLYRFGVHPGELSGLWGILFAPLLHGSWNHLASNSFALLMLGTVLLFCYPRAARSVLVVVYLGSGIGVWLFARHSFHFGASGLTHGMMFCIFTIGILRGDRASVALSLIVFFIYGGMVWTIFPLEPGISFESHFFGALCGTVAAFLYRNRDPLPPEKKYSWEEEDFEDDQDTAATQLLMLSDERKNATPGDSSEEER